MKRVRVLAIASIALVVACAPLTTAPPTLPPHPPATAVVMSAQSPPAPLVRDGQPVAWWFVFKFNAKSFPGCGSGTVRACPFGGTPQPYSQFSQQYVYASNTNPTLQKGSGCVGETLSDPLGATFDEIYNQPFHYVAWNDQFYDAPKIRGCSGSCSAPWGHSKGTLVWNDAGDGMVLQVTTPSWPAAASRDHPRTLDANSLGCVATDNNVLVSQHFFALKLSKDDVVTVLTALKNASVVTDTSNVELVKNGGPAEIQKLVSDLGVKSNSTTFTKDTLSTGVVLISKPSRLHVPPWQFVSAVLGGASLRTATWWANPKIYTTTADEQIDCWEVTLANPGAVDVATTGQWDGTNFGLAGGPGPDFNHAKIGVSVSNARHLAILGDMNQQGATTGNCASSQNGRGGLFFVVEDEELSSGLANLIGGDTAPTSAP